MNLASDRILTEKQKKGNPERPGNAKAVPDRLLEEGRSIEHYTVFGFLLLCYI
jgi:hypothetical protein